MLLRKMLRDMKKSRVQFVSIFLMSFLAVFIYSGLGSESRGYEVTLKQYYEETNMADLWLFGNNFTIEDEEKLLAIPAISGVSRRLYVTGNAELSNDPIMYMYFLEEDDICKTYPMEGKAFDPSDAEGVWVDQNFADAMNLKIGDSLTLTGQGITITKEIKGLILSPEYIYMQTSQMIPDHSKYGFVFLSKLSLPKMLQEVSTQMIVTIDKEELDHNNTNALRTLENKLYEELQTDVSTKSSGLSILIERKDLPSDRVFRSEIEERKSMTEVFPIAFLAIALLTIMTTMSRLVQSQRTQIGVLKALGFSKRKITGHYVGDSFLLTLSGGCIGAILGPLILPPMFAVPMRTTYTLPEWKCSFLSSTLLVIGVTTALATLITYQRSRAILAETPSSSLRPKAPKQFRRGWIEKTNIWKKLGFSIQWNIRDIVRSKVRSIMAIVGVAGCMGLLITGFGALDAFDGLISLKYDSMCDYENRINLEEGITDNQITDIQKEVAGELLMEDQIEVEYDGIRESTEITVNDNVTMIQYLDMEWQPTKLKETGINISYGLSKKLGIQQGDTLRWHRYGDSEWVTSKVSSIYRDPQEQGITISKEAFEDIGMIFVPTAVLTKEKEVNKLSGVTNIENVNDSKASINKMLESMYLLIAIICIAACVLAIVVLYNLGVLSFAEKERELATLKVLGFQGIRIRRLLLLENVVLTIIGLLPGYYFGKAVLHIIMYSVGTEFDFRLHVEMNSLLFSIAITVCLSVLVNFIFSSKINRLDMVAALKGAE